MSHLSFSKWGVHEINSVKILPFWLMHLQSTVMNRLSSGTKKYRHNREAVSPFHKLERSQDNRQQLHTIHSSRPSS